MLKKTGKFIYTALTLFATGFALVAAFDHVFKYFEEPLSCIMLSTFVACFLFTLQKLSNN